MIAIVFVQGIFPGLYGLDEQKPAACLPLLGRPVLQHAVEHLIREQVREFDFVVSHAPKAVQDCFGDGARWGCRFRWHITDNPDKAFQLIPSIATQSNEWYLWAQAERFPLLKSGEPPASVRIITSPQGVGLIWSPALLPDGRMWENEAALRQYLESPAELVEADRCLDVTSARRYLASQEQLLHHAPAEMTTGARQQEPGIWVSRHVSIHRSAMLIPPVYLGAHCRIGAGVTLGPNVSVGAHSVVDRHSVVRNSIVLPNTYIGQKLELVDSIADRRLLVNTRLSTGVPIQDRFLLNHLAGRRKLISLSRLI